MEKQKHTRRARPHVGPSTRLVVPPEPPRVTEAELVAIYEQAAAEAEAERRHVRRPHLRLVGGGDAA